MLCFVSVEDKLKDKLAIAAKEKLAAANKEKLIQAERKRKAAMFAAMLKSSQQDQQLQQQTATQRAQAAVQAGGEDPAAGIPPPAIKGKKQKEYKPVVNHPLNHLLVNHSALGCCKPLSTMQVLSLVNCRQYCAVTCN